ncbi:universal stress protein [Bacillus tianshenii]|nr:universal stress protein [Bacillus tianshenii]
MKKIIVPYDGSALAEKALRTAAEMAKAFQDEVHVVNIQSSSPILGENTVREAEAFLKEEGVAYSSAIRVGMPSIEIISEANDVDVRCIIMGSKGAGKAASKKFGSVSEAILQMVSCPIMIIPQ